AAEVDRGGAAARGDVLEQGAQLDAPAGRAPAVEAQPGHPRSPERDPAAARRAGDRWAPIRSAASAAEAAAPSAHGRSETQSPAYSTAPTGRAAKAPRSRRARGVASGRPYRNRCTKARGGSAGRPGRERAARAASRCPAAG